ncbi:NAD(P)/FAD-dependent oxidoreductase [Alterisphingorhabdus coralli]|uniref:NAD(P)/FAD-dependent oxidoreductase n=1 Tax=Alterisphingorhabdus coralli TaxID=3071408 RepID=A0AA97HZT4_9SPHN|nr:NAD(P)/FAD-dependent oxidoreductase [Parasphingorhabdus sp. SCSIO 66989]WOE75079.1 NAD(P)/FAD-dependent oxidoreductase [Parasphingorhabdus sp. SCSIO 66989]
MTAHISQYDTIIIGAGGAGLMCAAVAGQRGRSVLLIDHADKPGKKILISGGGRCNFTNLQAIPERFLSANRHFMKSALSRYDQHDFIAMVDRHGIAWHEKTLGQLFCDGSAKQIVAMLMDECPDDRVTLSLGAAIRDIRHSDGRFTVDYGDTTVTAASLVIATGGPSIPKMGATGFAYDVARQFGLKVVEPRPALVPLTLGGEDVLFRELSGVSAPVIARCGKTAFREAALFTHKGLSGPAILQISSYWRKGDAVQIDFLPDSAEDWLISAKQEHPRQHLPGLLGQHLPQRLSDALCGRLSERTAPLGECKDAQLRDWQRQLSDWRFVPNGSEGYAKAEVTAGGVSTAELSSKTMEAKKVSSLYFIGEGVDVTGWLGGYNFQWAWSSGWAAGQVV